MSEVKEPEVKKRFSLRTLEDMRELDEHILNGVLDGKVSTKQSDTINTTKKTFIEAGKLQLKYDEMLMKVFGPQIAAGSITLEEVMRMSPSPLRRHDAEHKQLEGKKNP